MKDKFKKNKELIFEIIAILLIILYAVSLSPKALQNDTYYTVTIGKQIIENGIDFKDHYSWNEDLPYTYPHWLYDMTMYLIYSVGGWMGIYISTCIFAAILGICIYKVNSRLTKNKLVSFFITIGSLTLLESYIAARAQLVTFILFILLVYNIERFIQVKKIRNVVALFLIQILIANLHIAVWPFTFVLYLPYIGEYLISELAEIILYNKVKFFILNRKLKKLRKKQLGESDNANINEKIHVVEEKISQIQKKSEIIKEKREKNLEAPYKIKIQKNKNVRWLILIMLLTILTGLCTPLRDKPFTYTYLTLVGNTTKYINEHLPMTLVENTKILCAIIIFIAIITFTKAKIRLSDLFMTGGLTYLMLRSRRQSSMFAIICTITLARLITDAIKIYFNRDGRELINKYISKFTVFVVSIFVIIVCAQNLKGKIHQNYIDKSSYPVEASDWILDNLNIHDIKLYNEYNFGSYLLYRGIPVFIDSRADLYAPEFNTITGDKKDGRDIFSDFINSNNIGTYYGSIFKKYGITHIIIKKDSKINMLIKNADSEKYSLLYSDDNFVIYEVLEY